MKLQLTDKPIFTAKPEGKWFSSANIEIDRKSWYYDLRDSLYILFAAAYNATCKNKMMQNAYKNVERRRDEGQKEN